jgi:hypothetical protein
MDSATVETTVESAGGFNIVGLVLILGGVLLLLLLVGTVMMLRQKDDRHLQLVGRTLFVGIVTVIVTVVLGSFEVLNPTLAAYLSLAEISLTVTAAWAFVLADAAMNEPPSGNDKVVWVIIIVLTGPLGAVLYMTLRRPQRKLQLAE